jgi:prepilin-type N-terminal cleavage/methylation domain-containing protein
VSGLFIFQKGFTRQNFVEQKLGGFTLLEILLVIGIVSILLVTTVPIGLDFFRNQQLGTQTQFLIQTLRRAQIKAMSVELDSSFGVYISNHNYTLFKGNSYLSRDNQYDEVFNLSEIINPSGVLEVVFSKFEAKPSATGNIILSSNSSTETININEMGRINLQ